MNQHHPPASAIAIMNDTQNDPFSCLSSPLKEYASAAFPPDEPQNVEEDKQVTSRRLDDFEVSLRSHAFELVETLMMQDEGTAAFQSVLEKLLMYLNEVTTFVLSMVQHAKDAPSSYSNATTPTFHRLPLTILSDTLQTLPISTIPQIWSSHPLSPFHSTPSPLCHPSIFSAGSKMLLLRICNDLLKNLSNRDADAEFAGSIMGTLSRVFPLSERSAMNVLGSFNVENVTEWEGREEFERNVVLRSGADGMEVDGSESGNSLGYEFYSTFWGVQAVFTDPPGTILAAKGGFEAFEAFVKDIKTILVAFESTPASFATSRLEEEEEVTHYKYLTSSQLLHLQLKDPELRTHFLTQLIILLSHLNSSSATLPAPSISSAPGSNPAKLNAQLKQTQLSQLSELEKRTQHLLKNLKPSGESHLRAICWILKEREAMWRNWKKNKCMPPLERESDKVNGAAVRKILSGRKRKADGAVVTTAAIDIRRDLPTIMGTIHESLPTTTSFLEPYVEALDPEAEVDAEYHPGNDKVYCWRALRLIARSQDGQGQLRRFAHLRRKDGNFEGIVRSMYKEDRGEEIPGDYVDVDDEEFQFRTKQEDTEDNKMDDVSVGTPEVDESAKKEKMSEFEKAAMEVEEEMLNEPEEDTGDVSEANAEDGDKAATEKEDEAAVKEEVQEEDNGKAEDSNVQEEVTAKKQEDEIKESAAITPPKEEHPSSTEKVESKANESMADKSIPVKEEQTSDSKTDALSSDQTQKHSTSQNGDKNRGRSDKDAKPTVHSAPKPRAKFTPKEQIQHSLQQNGNNPQSSSQKHSKDPSEERGTRRGSGSRQDRDSGSQDRRPSDSRRGQSQQQQRGGRGNRDEHSRTERPHESSGGGNDSREKRGDRYHNAPSQGGGRGSSWQPPTHGGRGGGRGGRQSNRDDRRGGRGRR